jgi:Derlin-2/3
MSPCLSYIMLYVWARKNPNSFVNFFELFQFRAPVLPWATLLMIVMLGYTPKYYLCGLAVGHIYYFIEDVIPKIPETEDFRVLKPPKVLERLCEYL